MGDNQSGGISKLLAAEHEATEIVNKARKAKTARLRQAQEEAAAELATYRAQREEAFKKLVASQTGDAGATMKQLEADSVQLNGSMAQNVASSKAVVVDMLVGFATTV